MMAPCNRPGRRDDELSMIATKAPRLWVVFGTLALLLTSALQPHSARAGDASPPELVFRETFNPPAHPWVQDADRRIVNGELRMQAVTGHTLSGFHLPRADAVYTARVRPLSADGGTFGLVARLQADGAGGYLVVVRPPDRWAVARLQAGQVTLLAKGTTPQPLRRGFHEVALRCEGNRLEARLGDQALATVVDDTFTEGGIGVWVDDDRVAAFDDLSVTLLAATPAETPQAPAVDAAMQMPTTPPPAAAIGNAAAVLFEERFDDPATASAWAPQLTDAWSERGLLLTAPDGRFAVTGKTDARFTDYRVTAAARRVDGPAHGRLGLVARLQPDGRSGYVLALSTGRWVALRLDADGVVELARGRLDPSVAVDRSVVLGVHCRGSRLQFDLNGATVATVDDATYASGGFGFYVDNGCRARFDDLVARTWA